MPVIDRSYSILTWFSDNSNCEISLLQFLQYALELNFCWKKTNKKFYIKNFQHATNYMETEYEAKYD